MTEKTDTAPEDFEVQSNFPEPNDPDLNAKVAGMMRVLDIEQSTQEFVDDIEGDLDASVNKAAGVGAKKLPSQQTTAVTDEDEILPLNRYPLQEQEKIVAKKLKLYAKTQANIRKEITRLIAISNSKEISPKNANKINKLISRMHSLDDRMALYTKKDEVFRKQRQQREQLILQQNKKKKLEQKVKKQKKQIKEAEEAQQKVGAASFLLPGKWLEIYKKNEQSRINEMKSSLSKDQAELQKLEKATAKKTPEKQPRTPPAAKAQKVVQAQPLQKDVSFTTQEKNAETPDAKECSPNTETPKNPTVAAQPVKQVPPVQDRAVKQQTEQRPPETATPELTTPSIPPKTTTTPQRLSTAATTKPSLTTRPATTLPLPQEQNTTTVIMAADTPTPKPTAPAQETTTKEKKHELFAGLFGHPEVKGAGPRSPTQLQGEAARQAAIDKDKRFEKSQQEVKRQEQRTTKKKTTS